MEHLTPAEAMPWPVATPFRMQPGLARLPGAETPPLFWRDALAPAYHRAKRAVIALADRAPWGATSPAVLEHIAHAFARHSGEAVAAEPHALTLAMQEDFVVLHDETDGFRTRLMSVCFPSNWNPAEKRGLDFTAIHAPVADNALLQAGARGIVDMAFRQAPMLRHVWLLTPDGALAQHPEARRTRWDEATTASGDQGQLIERVFFRVERQTTLPLPHLKAGVFFIRVAVARLADVLAVDGARAQQLHAAVSSMSESVVAYRGMGAVRERLLRELATPRAG